MPTAEFTVRVTSRFQHREGSQTWRAALIVTGMDGCDVGEIVQALAAFERTRAKGVQDPARWLTHFAGLESEVSGKSMNPWIELIYKGEPLTSTQHFRQILGGHKA